MIHEIELIGIMAKMYLGLSNGKHAEPSLHCCISVYDMNSESENIVRDSVFVCNIPFSNLSITMNGKTYKDWLEQMIKKEWILGFPDGYVNKAVKIKYHYDDKDVKKETLKIPLRINEAEEDAPQESTTKTVNYDRVKLIVSEIDFLDYLYGFTLHSDSTISNTNIYRPNLFEYSEPYEVIFENLQDYPDNFFSIAEKGDLLATKNELEQVLGAPVDFKVDKSKYQWIVKMTAKTTLVDVNGLEEPYTESYLFTVYDYSKGQELNEDDLYHYHIGGCYMLEGDKKHPMIAGNDVYKQMPLKLFKAKLMNKILEIRNNVNKE